MPEEPDSLQKHAESNTSKTDENNGSPRTPDGHKDPERVDNPNRLRDYFITITGLRILVFGILLGALSYLALPLGASTIGSVLTNIGGDSLLGVVITYVLGLIAISVVTLVIHERIHKWVDNYFGYDVEIKYGIVHSFALVEEQWIKRPHNILSYLAPLLIISATSYVICLLVPNQTLMVVFGMAFVVNTAASCSDLLNTFHFLRRPKGTLTWLQRDGDEIIGYISEPK